MISIGVASLKGALAYTHKCRVTPSAHMSHMRPSNLPDCAVSHISGAKKAGVPAVFCESADASAKMAVPKSAIFSTPSRLRAARGAQPSGAHAHV